MPATRIAFASKCRRESAQKRAPFHSELPPSLRPVTQVPRGRDASATAHLAGNNPGPVAVGFSRGPEGKESLLAEHLPMVRLTARSIHSRLPQHVELEDLVSAGMVGLLDAANKFDMGKKVQFRSYAQFRVRGAILDSLRALDWSPRYLRRKGRAVQQAASTLRARLGESPTDLEVANELQMGLGEYQQLLSELKGLEIGTLHSEHPEDTGEEELNCIPSRPEDDPLFRCLRGEVQQRLADAIRELPEREQLVMTLYYFEELTMKEIGLALNVVESRVSQIHSSALGHMRELVADMSHHRFRNEGALPAESKRPRAIAIAPGVLQMCSREEGAVVGTGFFHA
jgi:RNA polymerase sigma factor FliA